MDKHPKQISRAELIAELEAAGAVVKGSAIKCPFHDDHTPSGGVYEKAGVWRYKCQSCGAGGDVFDIQAMRTKRPLAEILKENTQDKPRMKTTPTPLAEKMTFASLEEIYGVLQAKHDGKLEAKHEYTQADGTHVQFMIRWIGADGKKQMRPAFLSGGKIVFAFPENRVLYHLPILAQAKTIIITEGELKADILAAYGFACTTSSGGGKAAAKTDWKPLAGKQIIIWPDADLPGRQYADDVRRILESLNPPAKVKIIDPAGLDLQDGEDSANYIQQLQNAGCDDLQTKENLIQVFAKAKSSGPGAEVVQLFSAIGAGRCEPIETGFRCLDDIMQILPGSLNLLCGSPGSSKSLLMLQLASRWFKSGVKSAIFELEKDRVFHLRRSLAQQSGLSQITNNKWTKENSELAQKTAIEHLDFLDNFGRLIYAMPEKIIFQRDVIEWIQQRADAGHKAVVIDPATKAERQDEPYKADGQFVQQLARIATTTRIVIFLVLHPSKNIALLPDLSLIAGGAAYSRFSDNAIWLEIHDEKKSAIKTFCGTVEQQHDRTIWILKSRDGSGTGSRLAYQFDKEYLTLREIGMITKKSSRKDVDS